MALWGLSHGHASGARLKQISSRSAWPKAFLSWNRLFRVWRAQWNKSWRKWKKVLCRKAVWLRLIDTYLLLVINSGRIHNTKNLMSQERTEKYADIFGELWKTLKIRLQDDLHLYRFHEIEKRNEVLLLPLIISRMTKSISFPHFLHLEHSS